MGTGQLRHRAATFGHVRVLEALKKELGRADDLSAQDDDLQSPALLAATRGQDAVVRTLHKLGAELSSRDRNGCTSGVPLVLSTSCLLGPLC